MANVPTRRCHRCKRQLPITDFSLRRKDGQQRHGHCRDCKAQYQREWYEKNRERHKAAVAVNRTLLRERNVAIIKQAKAVPCTDCGGRFDPCAMDFDHVRGKKRGNISFMVKESTQRLLEEIAKCEVVCANCHRLRTYRTSKDGHC